MNAYVPTGPDVLILAAVVSAFTLAAAFGLTRLPPGRAVRLLAWTLLVAAFIAAERLTAGEPAGFRMLAVIGALLFGMKGIVSVEARTAGQQPLSAAGWLAFAAGWPGMRPAAFAGVPGPARSGAGGLALSGCRSLALGGGCIAVARLVERNPQPIGFGGHHHIAVAALLLTGLSLVVHFGVFNILAGLWRLAGADCRPLFRAPVRSRSLEEFWSRRWNLAFSEMAVLAVYRPLRGSLGRRGARLAVFLFSGLVHELAISVPVKAGYGLPMTYFVLHAVAMQIEERLERAGRPIAARPWLGRMWTAAWLLVPLPILFHAPFLQGVVFPLIRAAGPGRTGG